MEDIKYVNLLEISLVVIEIWGVENGDLAVPVNNTFINDLCAACLLTHDHVYSSYQYGKYMFKIEDIRNIRKQLNNFLLS